MFSCRDSWPTERDGLIQQILVARSIVIRRKCELRDEYWVCNATDKCSIENTWSDGCVTNAVAVAHIENPKISCSNFRGDLRLWSCHRMHLKCRFLFIRSRFVRCWIDCVRRAVSFLTNETAVCACACALAKCSKRKQSVCACACASLRSRNAHTMPDRKWLRVSYLWRRGSLISNSTKCIKQRV